MINHCNAITAVILTYNEAPNVRHCLTSIHGFCDVMVVDSFSTDATMAICAEYNVTLVQHTYENHSSQWKWALENLPIETEWVLALDADFVVTEKLKHRIISDLESVNNSVAGIYVRHLYSFAGGPIRFGGTKQSWLRIIRKGRAQPDLSDLVDFRFVVDGKTITWREAIREYNRHDDDISIWLAKQDKFSLRLAVEEEMRRRGLKDWSIKPSLTGSTDQRFAKLRDLWMNLPLFLRPVLYFVYRYIFALGFLDGRAGFLYHVLQGFWLRLIVDYKTEQLRTLNLDQQQLDSFANYMLQHRDGSVTRLHSAWQEVQQEKRDGI